MALDTDRDGGSPRRRTRGSRDRRPSGGCRRTSASASAPRHARAVRGAARRRRRPGERQDPARQDDGQAQVRTKNDAVNGYVNQFFVTNEAKADRLGVCERLQAAGSPHVGEATVFVSWFLGTSIATLLDALGQFLKQHGLEPSTTFFWVCDYVIRQTDVGADLKYLGDCVAAIGHTALLLEPWDKPTALGRSYCLKEVVATQTSGAKFDVVMSEAQQAAFEAALGDGHVSQRSRRRSRASTCARPPQRRGPGGDPERARGDRRERVQRPRRRADARAAREAGARGAREGAGGGAGDVGDDQPGGGAAAGQGKLKEAEPLCREAVEGYREKFGRAARGGRWAR